MAFTIPDKGEALSNNQSILFQEYLDVLTAGISGVDGVVSGCTVTAQGIADMTVAVASGIVRSNNLDYVVAGANIAIGVAHSSSPRFDLIVINSAGTLAVRAGEAVSAPKPAGKNSNDVVLAVVYVPAGAVAINSNQIVDLRVIVQKRERIAPEDFGAVGDGAADDTAAFVLFVAALNADTTIRRAVISGAYLIDFTLLTSYRFTVTRDDLLITGGGTIKAKVADYSAGVAAGTHRYYMALYCTGNRVTVENITIDGNNQFAQYPSSAVLPNHWLRGVYMQGTAGTPTRGGRIVNCRYINGGGWSFTGQYHQYGEISGCYMEHSQGCGFDGGVSCIVVGNQSYNAHDAHFAAWNSTYFVISNNVAYTNDNGSGIDVSGSKRGTVSDNVIYNNTNRAIWVLQDPNTGASSEFITIQGNICQKNRNYVSIAEGGEIHIAGLDPISTSSPGRVDGKHIIISGNTLEPNNGNGISLGPYASYVTVTGNHIAAYSGSSPARGMVVYQATNVTIRDNTDLIGNSKTLGAGPLSWETTDGTTHDFSAASPTFQPLRRRIARIIDGMTDALSASSQRYTIRENWGHHEFSARYTIAATPTPVFNFTTTAGGYIDVVIELTATASGERGIVGQRYYYKIYAGNVTAYSAADTIFTKGTAPPTISVATAAAAGTASITFSVAHSALCEGGLVARVHCIGKSFTLNSLLT